MVSGQFWVGLTLGMVVASAIDLAVMLKVRPYLVNRRVRQDERAFKAGMRHVREAVDAAEEAGRPRRDTLQVLVRRCSGAETALTKFEEGMRWQLRLMAADRRSPDGRDVARMMP